MSRGKGRQQVAILNLLASRGESLSSAEIARLLEQPNVQSVEFSLVGLKRRGEAAEIVESLGSYGPHYWHLVTPENEWQDRLHIELKLKEAKQQVRILEEELNVRQRVTG